MDDAAFRKNAIGLLRFVLASLVIVSHSIGLGWFGQESWGSKQWYGHNGSSLGSIAVMAFFFLSGLLITRSFVNAPSVWRYLWQRCLRILPAYWVCLFVVAFVICPFVYRADHGTIAGYFTHPHRTPNPFIYIFNKAQFGKMWVIWDVFKDSQQPFQVNAPLWTLRGEFTCYLAVALLGVLGLLRRRWATLLVLAAMIFIVYAPEFVPNKALLPETHDEQMMRYYMLFFALGAVTFVYREYVPIDGRLALLALIAIVGTMRFPIGGFVLPIAMSYGLLWLAFRLPIYDFDRRMDLSYGLYIYSFPMQQLLARFGVYKAGFIVFLAASFACALALAALSWFLIEKPALSFKHWTPPWRRRATS